MIKRYLVVPALLLTLVWMGIVYCFSAENATESKRTSVAVMEKISEALNINIENRSAFEDKLRTFAHFILYLCGGAISYTLIIIAKLGYKHKATAACVFGLLYAVIDEIHQIFVPGRSFEYKDIAVDFSGFMLGVYFAIIVFYLSKRFIKRNKDTD